MGKHCSEIAHLFSRKHMPDRKPLDLNNIIGNVGTFLARVMGEDITCRTLLAEGALTVPADAHQIEQVLMNLATNARDAMANVGVFTIATRQVTIDADFAATHGYDKAGDYALITISDTGKGMDQETKNRVFDPFFTTKEVGKGTGLGMSVVHGIIKQHEGYIDVHSEPGTGTTFKIFLPIIAPAADTAPAAAPEEQSEGGVETILLAEDDKTVRELTQMLLEDYGYTVIPAVDGADAVLKFKEYRDRIQLLLFDLIMPKMTGKDAYDEIRGISPGIKVIFSSGYDPDMVRFKAQLEQNVAVVYKPVSIVELLRTIHRVLKEGKGEFGN